MYRGTTPTLQFKLPFSAENIEVLNIAFAQKNNVVLEKGLEDAEIEGDTVNVTLSQEDTLAFDADISVEMQIRCRNTDGNALASNIIKTKAKRILKEGEI